MMYILIALVFVFVALSALLLYILRSTLKDFADFKDLAHRTITSANERVNRLLRQNEQQIELRLVHERTARLLNEKCTRLEKQLQELEYKAEREPIAPVNPSDDVPPTLTRNM